jgi:hypothetical protein
MQNNNNKYSLVDKWGKLCIFYKKPCRCTPFPRDLSVPEKTLLRYIFSLNKLFKKINPQAESTVLACSPGCVSALIPN